MSDQEFFDCIYKRCYEKLYTFVFHRVHDSGLAENLAQDTLLWAWAKIGDLRKRDPPEKWLYTTAKFLILKENDRMYHKEISLADVEFEAILDKVDTDPFDNLPPELKPDEVQLLKLRYGEQMDYFNIASLLGVKVDTARKRTHRAAKRCRELLEKDGEALAQ